MLDLEFSELGYSRLIAALARSHRLVSFAGYDAGGSEGGPACILRHDVDYCPEAALRVGEMEHEAGARSTFFFLLGGPFYNLFGPQSRVLRQLLAMGHEVGLHYDVPSLESRAGPGHPLEIALAEEAKALADLCGDAVHTIAPHNVSLLNGDPFAGTTAFRHAYEPRYVSDIPYMSDSAGAWRNTAWQCLTSGQFPERFQLLTHPLFWASAGHRLSKLEALGAGHRAALGAALDDVRKAWEMHSGRIEHDARGTSH